MKNLENQLKLLIKKKKQLSNRINNSVSRQPKKQIIKQQQSYQIKVTSPKQSPKSLNIIVQNHALLQNQYLQLKKSFHDLQKICNQQQDDIKKNNKYTKQLQEQNLRLKSDIISKQSQIKILKQLLQNYKNQKLMNQKKQLQIKKSIQNKNKKIVSHQDKQLQTNLQILNNPQIIKIQTNTTINSRLSTLIIDHTPKKLIKTIPQDIFDTNNKQVNDTMSDSKDNRQIQNPQPIKIIQKQVKSPTSKRDLNKFRFTPRYNLQL